MRVPPSLNSGPCLLSHMSYLSDASRRWSTAREAVLQILLRIAITLGVLLVLLGVYVVVEPLTEASMYILASLLFLALVLVVFWRLSRHRPRSSRTLSTAKHAR